MTFSKKLLDIKQRVLEESRPLFKHIDAIAEQNTLKVLDAMRKVRVSDAHFNTTSGYAYDDIGRSKLGSPMRKSSAPKGPWSVPSSFPAPMLWPLCSSAYCGPEMSWYPSPAPPMIPCRRSSAMPIPARVP